MRHAILLTALACSLFSSHCGSTSDTTLIRQRIALIKAWHLVYSSRVDPNYIPSRQENPSTRSGQVDRNLEFLDFTSEVLKKRFGVPVAEDITAVCGQIRLTTMESPNGPPKYVDIALYDLNNQLLARSRVWNDTQAMIETSKDTERDPHSFNQSFAAYVAERIADLLVGKQTIAP